MDDLVGGHLVGLTLYDLQVIQLEFEHRDPPKYPFDLGSLRSLPNFDCAPSPGGSIRG
jgi:hypothetical protein